MIIVVTGLKLRALWHYPAFTYHAFRSFGQAQRAEGCLSAQTRKVGPVYHTITAWRDGAAMKRYASRGAHGEAERAFSRIATGRVVIFQSDAVPDWPQALEIWHRDAHEV